MTNEDMQRLGKDGADAALSSFGLWSKSAQAIVTEVMDFSKMSVENSAAAWEKLAGAKSLERAVEVQSEYFKASYEHFIAEATKLGELYLDFAKDTYRPFEGALAKVSAMK